MRPPTRLVIASLSLVLAACGPSGVPLNPALAGLWAGTASISIAGHAPSSYGAKLAVTIDGHAAAANAACPDGTGMVNLNGSGDGAEWSGHLQCPATSIENCGSVMITYRSGWIRLAGSGAFQAAMLGSGDWCGLVSDANLYFESKQQ